LVETARVHITKAEGISSFAQTLHVGSYPLKGDDPHESSRETEHQAEEPEDIYTDADGVNTRLNPCDPNLACRLSGNLLQELNAFLSGIWLSEVLM
jgi:hypothetical protein